MKQLIHPNGMTVCFGRKRPTVLPRLHFANFVDKSKIPTPPATFTYGAAAQPALKLIYKNDVLGCCVPAGKMHVAGVITANATGTPVTFTDDQLVWLYGKDGSYDPTQVQPNGYNPTDEGCDEVTAFKNWINFGLTSDGLHKISAFIAVDATDKFEVQAAAYLFENLIFGVELPDKWVNPFPESDGFVWDAAGHPIVDNGHCFMAYGYDSVGTKIDTWAMQGTCTYKAMAKYATPRAGGGLYTVLSPEIIQKATNKAPNGFDIEGLQKALSNF